MLYSQIEGLGIRGPLSAHLSKIYTKRYKTNNIVLSMTTFILYVINKKILYIDKTIILF